MAFFFEYSYWGLLAASFLAATVLPFSSEVILGTLLLNGYSPVSLVFIATIGNVAGAVVNYVLGVAGAVVVLKKIFRVSQQDLTGAQRRFVKYGMPCLIFSWLPVIGDPLTVMAGLLRVNFFGFLILVTIGKLLRYVAVSYMVLVL
ncbi:MAG: DedA family protein [Desulfobacteraceae bacterium]|nr:DedA family protein [Desulfobacteraceae bacterium]